MHFEPTVLAPVPADRPHLAHWPARLPRTLSVPETTLWFNAEVSATRHPDKPAYVFFGRPLAYRELHRQAELLAGWLQSQGLQAGDRVLLFMQNCPQWVVAFYGILRAGGVVVPVNPMNKADEFGHYITDPSAKLAITSADLAAIVVEADARLAPAQRLRRLLVTRFADALPEDGIPAELAPAPAVRDWLLADHPLPAGAARWDEALAEGQRPGPLQAGPDDLAVLPYTSGTTGLPKGCLHTHRTLMSNAVGSQWSYAGPETVSLGVVPMFHITGLIYLALANVYGGSTTVLLPRWDR